MGRLIFHMGTTALLLVDIQTGFDAPGWGHRNNPLAETNSAKLLTVWRSQNFPVIHVRHCSTEANSPLRPNQPGYAFKPAVTPRHGERVFTKRVNSAFIGTNLEDYLRENGLGSLVIVGLTTDHCISTTVRMAGNLGFKVQLVSDATATFDRTDMNGQRLSADAIHNIHLVSLHGEFCTVVTTGEVLAQVAS